MTELSDIATLAFADDGTVCLLVAALASLLVGGRLTVGHVTVLAFLGCWIFPVLMLLDQYERDVVASIAKEAVLGVPADALWLITRFAGMYLVVSLSWRMRLAIHGRRPVTEVRGRTA